LPGELNMSRNNSNYKELLTLQKHKGKLKPDKQQPRERESRRKKKQPKMQKELLPMPNWLLSMPLKLPNLMQKSKLPRKRQKRCTIR